MIAVFIAYFAENVCIQNSDFTQFPRPLDDEIGVGNNEKRDNYSPTEMSATFGAVFHIQILLKIASTVGLITVTNTTRT